MNKTFDELFQTMLERKKQMEEANLPPAHALELKRQELRQEMGCPDDEALCGFVDWHLRRKSLWNWLKVSHHLHIRRCPSCQEDVESLVMVISPTNPTLGLQTLHFGFVSAIATVLLLFFFLFTQINAFNMEASLSLPTAKGGSQGNRDAGSVGTPIPLESGESFQIRIQTSQSAYIYLINYDSRGEAELIFPSKKIGLSNPIIDKREYLIPSHNELPFRLVGSPGMETIFILASKDRLTHAQINTIEGQIESFGSPESGKGYQNKIKRIMKELKNQGFEAKSLSIEHKEHRLLNKKRQN
jgi:hypothetical protein